MEDIRVGVPVGDIGEGEAGAGDRHSAQADVIEPPGAGEVMVEVVHVHRVWLETEGGHRGPGRSGEAEGGQEDSRET